MEPFSGDSDEQIVLFARSGNQEALAELVRRYYLRRFHFFYRAAPSYWRVLGEGECNAVFFSTLLDSVTNFRIGEVSFAIYFEKSFRNNILRLYRAMFPNGESPLSLDQYIGDKEEGTCLADSIPCSSAEDPRISYSLLEEVERLADLKKGALSRFDLRVSEMRSEGKSYRFIAERYHCSIKRVRIAYDHYLVFLHQNLS
ncbi:MAG: hypothetical protein WCS90_00740 [Bacilli bacterium]